MSHLRRPLPRQARFALAYGSARQAHSAGQVREVQEGAALGTGDEAHPMQAPPSGQEYLTAFAALRMYQGESMDAKGEAAKVRRFETHVLVHVNDLYRAARRLTGKAPDAEDLVQETCLRAFQALDQLRHPRAAKAWVFAILRSVFLRQAERRDAQPIQVSLEDLDGLVPATDVLCAVRDRASPLQETLLQEIRQATLGLPLPYREVIVLAHVGGFSYREMAQILEVPLGTVMSRLFRARRRLRAALQGAGEHRPHVEPAR